MAPLLCLLACGSSDAAPVLVPLRLHSIPGCVVPKALARSTLQLVALGDFAPSNDSAEALTADAAGRPLRFPAATRAALAQLDTPAAFFGYGERRGEAPLDVLLWPANATCAVSSLSSGAAAPTQPMGRAVAFATELDALLIAGGDEPLNSDVLVGATLFDVATGRVRTVDTRSDGALREPRAYASATPFGEGFLVAGGQRPVANVDAQELALNDTAEVFDAAEARFSSEPIQLLSARTHHAAVALANGRTLLIGGRSKVGSTSFAQYQLELVDPVSRRSSLGDAVTARIDPRAIKLSDGRVLVAGGTTLEGAPAQPVAEWLSSEGSLTSTRLSLDVPPRFDRAFVATPGGGVLAVGGCEDRPPASDEDRSACTAACVRGCPPLGGYDAWWIDARGGATPLPLDGISAPRPMLLDGSDGRPWLVAASAGAPKEPRLFRFDPWNQVFEAIFTDPAQALPGPGQEPVAFDRDAFVWPAASDDGAVLLGLRLGARSRYAQDSALVLNPDPEDVTRPLHLAPNGPTGAAVIYDGKLVLRGADLRHAEQPPDDSPDVVVQVADTDYGDVTIALTVAGRALPIVLLGQTELGGPDCPWPSGNLRGGEHDRPEITRHGSRAELRYRGGKVACDVEEGRLALALRASKGEARVSRMDVTRGTPADQAVTAF